jgi:hypothetical protein
MIIVNLFVQLIHHIFKYSHLTFLAHIDEAILHANMVSSYRSR